jgi:hypothetical protein
MLKKVLLAAALILLAQCQYIYPYTAPSLTSDKQRSEAGLGSETDSGPNDEGRIKDKNDATSDSGPKIFAITKANDVCENPAVVDLEGLVQPVILQVDLTGANETYPSTCGSGPDVVVHFENSPGGNVKITISGTSGVILDFGTNCPPAVGDCCSLASPSGGEFSTTREISPGKFFLNLRGIKNVFLLKLSQ